MANQLDVNPWVLDTVMATPYRAYVYIGNIFWTDAAALGHQVILLDQNGKTIFDSIASSPDFFQGSGGKLGWVNGIQLTKIDSGKLTISISK